MSLFDQFAEDLVAKSFTLQNGVTVLNVTPHPLTFGYEDGTIDTVPTSGYVAFADTVFEPLPEVDGIEFVHTVFAPRQEQSLLLAELVELLPACSVIVGSIIAAQAYPEIVTGMQLFSNRETLAGDRVYRTDPNRFNRAN